MLHLRSIVEMIRPDLVPRCNVERRLHINLPIPPTAPTPLPLLLQPSLLNCISAPALLHLHRSAPFNPLHSFICYINSNPPTLNTWRALARGVGVGCAYKAGRSGRASMTWRSPMSIKGPSGKRGGCARKGAGLIQGGLRGCSRCPVRLVRGVVRDGRGREAAARRGEVSRRRITSGIDDRWEGLNAKPRCRTLVLVGSTLKAANPTWGLGGRVRR